MADTSFIAAAKLAGRITTNAYDTEIGRLLDTALLDLGVAGVEYSAIDPLVETAAITYFRLHFGNPDDYERLERSYNEQKAQLSTHSGHTSWSVNNG